MARIALVMHAPLGAAFLACAKHVLGRTPELKIFDVQPADDPDEIVHQLTEWIEKTPGQATLILCDIFGATPFNIANRALKLAIQHGMEGHLITGTNLCMVLKALTDQQENPDKLSENVRLGALKGIINAE